MTLTLLSHQWKSFRRSENIGKSIVVQIVIGLLMLYLLLNILVIAFFLDKILGHAFIKQNVITSFNSLLLYYFLFDIWTRYQFQELPTLSIQPYLLFPVKRNQLVNYLCFTSLWSGFTIAPYILTLPFLIKIILPQLGTGVFFGFIIFITGITIFNHFFILWLKRRENLNSWYMVLFLMLLIATALADFYWHLISISHYSMMIFGSVAARPVYSLAAILIGILMYVYNYNYLRNNLYLEELQTTSSSNKSSTDYPFLNQFGKIGDLAANEIKLVLRNKRPRSTVAKSILFLFYGLLFYPNSKMADSFLGLMFCPMFMTGIFIINYGQFMFGWQSSHFDGVLVNKIAVKDFFKSKFLLFTLFSCVAFILTTPYVYFGWKILMMLAVMSVWNIGVNTVLVLYFANMNYKSIDLSKKASFNWEGVGATQWVLSIPLLLSPYVIYLPFYWAGYSNAGIAALVLIGISFILTREFWLNKLVTNFNTNRYKIAEGFRNN